MFSRSVRRAIVPLLQDGNRAIATAIPAAQAVPAVSPTGSSGGFLSSIFGGSSRLAVPMTEPLPGVVEPPVVPVPSGPPKTEQTTLANGFRVASEPSMGPTACAAILVSSGSVYETREVSGISHVLEQMAFKETHNRTHFRIMQEITGYGANIIASASREQMYYSIDCLRSDLPAAIEVLSDCVLNPKFNPWDVSETLQGMRQDIENLKKNPQGLLGETLTNASYTGGLSNPLICPESSLDTLTQDHLLEFHSENFTAPRMALSVAGAEHQDVLRWAEPMLKEAERDTKLITPPSTYVGGEVRMPGADELTHVILGFDSPGGWKNVKSAATMTVLLYMMGGGGSFSAGGPGKGMHSRLYLNVLTKHHWVQNFSAINQAFDDRCLAGVYGAAPASMAGQLVDIMCNEMTELAKSVNDEELQRAKSASIGQILMTLENKAVAAEDIGRQVLTYGHRKPASDFIAEIKKVSAKDLTGMVSEMLKSPASMASMGDLSKVPRYSDVARRFG
ncbi:hypothetical protein BSKO_04903 [Bryopsis sp. KO-2023]|nr:hypothetical protein BSKO_04903 [Bryopsis sp. KO-2023]